MDDWAADLAMTSEPRSHHASSLDRREPFEDNCVLVVIETPKNSSNKLAFEPAMEPLC